MNKVAMVVIGVAVAVGGYWWLAVPHNYEDCVLKNMEGARSEKAANLVSEACRKKFRSYSFTSSPKVTSAPLKCSKDNPYYKYCDQD